MKAMDEINQTSYQMCLNPDELTVAAQRLRKVYPRYRSQPKSSRFSLKQVDKQIKVNKLCWRFPFNELIKLMAH